MLPEGGVLLENVHLLKLKEKDTAILTGKTPSDHRRLFWECEARVAMPRHFGFFISSSYFAAL
jgi:hypothetical protein